MKTKTWAKKNSKTIIVIVVIIVFVLLSGFGGNSLYNYHKNALESLKMEKDSLLRVSEFRFDSVVNKAQELEIFADNQRYENDQLRIRNNNLYYELKKGARDLRNSDTVFANNAKRISNSSRRYYQRNDSIR